MDGKTVHIVLKLTTDKIIALFLEAEERGEHPDPEEWVRRHPHAARELQEFFTDHRNFSRAVGSDLRSQQEAASTQKSSQNADGPSPSLFPSDNPSGRFGEYELLGKIAAGAMGIVCRARHVNLKREVALKMMLTGRFADPEEVQRFRAEAQAAARLDHPNIVSIYEVGEHLGQQYYTMRLIEGVNLADAMPEMMADPRRAAGLLATVARAVHYAHEHGIIHRDIKPANIMIDGQGQPHVADFGLAKCLDNSLRLTVSGAAMGSPPYMAPEQASGNTKHLTPAADIYSLGAVLYEILTGDPPFTGETAVEVLLKVCNDEPRSPGKVKPGVDSDLGAICMKCLDKVPHRRYATALDLALDLESWLAGRGVSARLATPAEQALKWARRHPSHVATLVMALALAGTSTVAYHWRPAAGAPARAATGPNAQTNILGLATALLEQGRIDMAKTLFLEVMEKADDPQNALAAEEALRRIAAIEARRARPEATPAIDGSTRKEDGKEKLK